MAGDPAGVGDVVAMGEEHGPDPAERRDAAHQRIGKARRIDQDVAARPDDQIGGRPIAGGGVVAAMMHPPLDPLGGSVPRRPHGGARRPWRSTVPMAPTGQAISASSARRRWISSAGWWLTQDASPALAKLAGATQRQVPQSMQLASTKKSPATLAGRRATSEAMISRSYHR